MEELSSKLKNLPPILHRAFDILELVIVLLMVYKLYVSPATAGVRWTAALPLLALPFTGRR